MPCFGLGFKIDLRSHFLYLLKDYCVWIAHQTSNCFGLLGILLFNAIMNFVDLWWASANKMVCLICFQSIGPLGQCFLKVEISVCVSVCLSVCLSVCSLLRYRLNVFLPPLPKVGYPIFLEIRNPWGKVMERSGLRLEHFCLLILPYKTWWKPRFPMD